MTGTYSPKSLVADHAAGFGFGIGFGFGPDVTRRFLEDNGLGAPAQQGRACASGLNRRRRPPARAARQQPR